MSSIGTYSPTPWSAAWMNRPATEKAIRFARSLYIERKAALTDEQRTRVEIVLSATLPNAGDVSYTIDRLKETPRPASTPTTTAASTSTVPVSEPGFYLHDETLYRVQESRSSGRLYAKILVVDETADGERKGRFEYANGAVYRLRAEERLTAEQAARLGHAYGFCVRCCKALDDPRSVAAGYGETCATREGWHYPTAAEAAALLTPQAA